MYKRMRILFLISMDIILIQLAYFISIYLRFDGFIEQYVNIYLSNIFVISAIKICVLYMFKLYQSLWKYASIEELLQVVGGVLCANGAFVAYMYLQQQHLPRSIYVVTTLLEIMFIGGVRFTYRMMRRVKNSEILSSNERKRIMIVGAGDAGVMVMKEIRNNDNFNGKPVALIDDDVTKQRKIINNVPVLGQRLDIASVAYKKKIDEIIICIPSADKNSIKNIIEECKRTKCKLRILPRIDKIINGKVKLGDIRDVQIEDLLGREEVNLNIDGINNYLKGKKVVVTGGGGSIGSELCRQIASFGPRELVIIDIYENNAYDLQNELIRKSNVELHNLCDSKQVMHKAKIRLKVIIASVRDKKRIDKIFKDIQPDVVFHAAAHKHVPLMEDNPTEAIKNNVFGTLNVAQCADKYNVKKFVLISTDKAVNPTNVMGATKRLCELVIQSIDKVSKTEFAAVRFGNVLGSNGSVIPLFKKQIAEGGPLTVTHEDIIRYFMTIPEAARLVIQAGALAKGGEIFILDMGEPVKIMDLAKDLIKLSGLKPYTDIPIEVTGLRPGEKLYEELLMAEEGMTSTSHNKIFIGRPTDVDYMKLLNSLDELKNILNKDNHLLIKKSLSDLIPTYKMENKVINGEFMQRIAEREIAAAKG
ncbi:nucleoside-diphosphate sugar epimerase [Vallitalea longa]|uniref:Nucleoside-diphosphate sugar epimerase n=1 Tax=Vallitalea longa TaxID=2936439 RepID=A0A9W5YEV0_9FIRM|nr:nucleoside-diphosphate sugar epimerase/dehydratase [Vallitalea longa]GKX31769.1 nucleoside-diphosphate sugar epimerase [Vallitalea longa]